MSWKQKKQWSDTFLNEIKGILGQKLICEPPVEEDQKRNTDLMVLKMDAIRVACRVRKNSYLKYYSDEFTIRSCVKSGNKTELSKIIEGWGDYLFYAFCDATEKTIEKWFMIDLNVFRLWINRHMYSNNGSLPCLSRNNVDGSSSFAVFNLKNAPDGIIFAESAKV